MKYQLIELSINKYSGYFRQQQYFAFYAVGGACLSGLLSKVDMSSFCI